MPYDITISVPNAHTPTPTPPKPMPALTRAQLRDIVMAVIG